MMKELIKQLVETPSPSGYEKNVRDLLRGLLEPVMDEIKVDALGNLIARQGQAGENGLRIMLSAHMDEIGLVASHIDERGFIRFQPLGGVGPRNLPGGRVRFLNGPQGVIGLERTDDRERVPPLEKMFIDVGARSRQECPVRVGDVAVFQRDFLDLGSRLVSKAMDDRIGVAVLVEAARALAAAGSPHALYFVFSTQEEVGLRGATTAAFGVQPDLGLAVDVTGSGDTPKGITMEVGLGNGPAIKIRDGGMLADPRVVDWMVRTAQAAGLPYQLEILEGGTTDAKAIQVSQAGVPAGCLSIPCRYVHSPSEMVDFDDVQNAVRLLVELLRQPVQLAT
jgi:endoglucanase